MALANHDPTSLREIAKQFRGYAESLSQIADTMESAGLGEAGIPVNYEQYRLKATMLFESWLTDAKKKLKAAAYRAKSKVDLSGLD